MTIDAPGEPKEKLTIDLLFQKPNLDKVTLKIGWGKIQLSAPIQVPMPTA